MVMMIMKWNQVEPDFDGFVGAFQQMGAVMLHDVGREPKEALPMLLQPHCVLESVWAGPSNKQVKVAAGGSYRKDIPDVSVLRERKAN